MQRENLNDDRQSSSNNNFTPTWLSKHNINMRNSTGISPRRGRRWKLLTPAVMWTIVMLAMAPSLYGFGVARMPRVGTISGGVGIPAGGGFASAKSEAVGPHPTAASVGWGQRGGTWLKERIRDGKRKLHMQVMSMVPETTLDAKCFEGAPVPTAERVFLINGWRWHSRAVVRDVARFRRVAILAAEASGGGPDVGGTERQEAVEKVLKCYRYLWTFSVGKLHKCESMFFPWLRELLPREALPGLEEFEREREAVVRLGNKIGQVVEEAVRATAADRSPRAALLRCADLSSELEGRTALLMRAQESAIVPVTAAYVGAKVQGKFNDKVVFSLGLLDAQVLLVSMYDAIESDREEMEVFRSQVPKFARALLPTWRKLLYSPRAGCLDDTS